MNFQSFIHVCAFLHVVIYSHHATMLPTNRSPIDFLVVQVLSALNLYRFVLITEATGKGKFFGITTSQTVFFNTFASCFFQTFLQVDCVAITQLYCILN